MADTTTSGEISGAPVQLADLVRIARSGSNFKLTVAELHGAIDITWADLLTAIGGSTLSPNAIYHVTTAPDSSTTIDEAWVRAKDANEIFPDGECLINAANITNRLAGIRFQMAAGAGGRVQAVYEGFGNITEAHTPDSAATNSTVQIDRWLDLLTATNYNVKNFGCNLAAGASGTVGDQSVFMRGSSLQLSASSSFTGLLTGGAVLAGGSIANDVQVHGALNLDNSTTVAISMVGISKTLTIADGQTYLGFSTEGNTKLHEDGTNASGDTVTVDATDGVVYIVNGVTDITINMPTGLIAGQQMMIYFKTGSAAVTWGGAPTEPGTFIAAPAAESRILTFWDASGATWR